MAWKKGLNREVFESISSVLSLFLTLVACVELCDAATVLDVYRIIQYDLAGVPLGSRFSRLNHHAGSSFVSPYIDLSRTAVIMHVRDINVTFLNEFITNKRPLGGLLLLLPQILRDQSAKGMEKTDLGLLKDMLLNLERLLVHVSVPYPVYFTFDDENIDSLLADVKKNEANGQPAMVTTGGYKLVVSTPEPKKLTATTMTILEGWLPGFVEDAETNQLPTIAIVASYDTFGVAPALSSGSDSNGSGVVALLEIARLFSLLYSSPRSRGRYNLLFALTSGGPYNYDGSLKWLRGVDQRLRESIDYAICLNSIGSWTEEMWLHASKPPENIYIKQIYDSLSDVAEELGVTVHVKHKKINISNSRVAWEHEQFSRFRVTAVTLSGLSSPPELFENSGGLSDSRLFINSKAVLKDVKLIAESLARHIYGQQGTDIQIFADGSSLAVSPPYIQSWLDLLSRTPRVTPFLTKDDPVISALKKELAEHALNVKAQYETLDGTFSFYDQIRATLHIYQVASVTFDLLLLLAVGCYLSILFVFLVCVTKGFDDLVRLFRRPPSRKVKAL